jgi:3',5'-cyclic AMP phosphodiesterase CpdA
LRLLAISDLHVAHDDNRAGLERLTPHHDDWLIVAGDVGERPAHLVFALETLTPRFARVIWTPGNHDLWCPRDDANRTRGQARYDELIGICRRFGVLTPEDPYERFPIGGAAAPFIVPMFLLYDYSFRPADIPAERALQWARETGVVCADEQQLDPAPWPSRAAWCDARCRETEHRLRALPANAHTILVNHWPLRYDLARPPAVPRFSIWSGTTRTEDWPQRFRATVIVSGHLHLRTTLWRDGVRCEEVSLGYPRDWRHERGVDAYLREILPGPADAAPPKIPPRDPYLDALPPHFKPHRRRRAL